MGKLNIPISDHKEIRKSREMRSAVGSVSARIASESGQAAHTGGFESEVTVGSDRARGHVWPATPKAKRAEAKHRAILQAASRIKP